MRCRRHALDTPQLARAAAAAPAAPSYTEASAASSHGPGHTPHTPRTPHTSHTPHTPHRGERIERTPRRGRGICRHCLACHREGYEHGGSHVCEDHDLCGFCVPLSTTQRTDQRTRKRPCLEARRSGTPVASDRPLLLRLLREQKGCGGRTRPRPLVRHPHIHIHIHTQYAHEYSYSSHASA